MRVLLLVVGVLAATALAGLAFIYSGVYNVAATGSHFAPTAWVIRTTFRNSVAARAADIDVPVLDEGGAFAVGGAQRYEKMCTICHGRPGDTLPQLAQGLLPQPPQFSESPSRLATNQTFWVIKNGVRMTGMPAFGPTLSDQEIWSLAGFMITLPRLTRDQYDELITNSGSDAG